MNAAQLKTLYPHASASFIKANATDGPAPSITVNRKNNDEFTANRLLGIMPSSDEAKLNKTETAYLAWLRALGAKWIGVQCLTLKLGHDCRYTPDFWALDNDGLRAIDTKAFWKAKGKPGIEDDAKVKIAVAARLFPWIRFVIAWREGSVWQHRDIKP